MTKSSEKQAWLVLEAELELAKDNPAKAGLAAMRVIILHPESVHVGPALYWAARSCEGLQRPLKAIELYEECLEKTPKGTKSKPASKWHVSMRRRATARLAALKKQAPDR